MIKLYNYCLTKKKLIGMTLKDVKKMLVFNLTLSSPLFSGH